MTLAISDIGTKLWKKVGNAVAYSVLVPVISVPASGSAPEQLEATELHMTDKAYIEGRIDRPAMAFQYNYTEDNYVAVEGACTGVAEEFLVVYGDGSGTYIEGFGRTWINEGGRNAVMTATFHITPSSVLFKTASEVTALLPTS